MIQPASHDAAPSLVFAPENDREGVEVPASALLTLDGFRAWYAGMEGAGVQASWVDGMLFLEMSPQNCRQHAPIVSAINLELGLLNRALGKGAYYVPPSWLTVAEAGLSTEPDGFVVAWDALRSGRVRVNPARNAELTGAPDWAFEVVSPSSRKKDLVRLRAAYARAGVEEYWVVDPDVEPLQVCVLVLSGEQYVEQPRDAEGFSASPFWDRTFRLVRFMNPAGQPDARLEVRPGA